MIQRVLLPLFAIMLVAGPVFAKRATRDVQVRGDLKDFSNLATWIYNDLNKGIAGAKKTGRPLLIVFR